MARLGPIALCVLLGVSVSCADQSVNVQGDDETLPPEFSLDVMAPLCLPKGTYPLLDDAPDGVEILAWNKLLHCRDKGPDLESWNALVWQECLDDDNRVVWVLKTMYLHPSHENEWRAPWSSHSNQQAARVLDSPPTLEDVFDFLHASYWNYAPLMREGDRSASRRVMQSGLPRQTWKRLFGFAPRTPIPKESARSRALREKNRWQGPLF